MVTRLRQMREREGWTQRELAERAGLDVQRISLAERSLNPGRISARTVLPLAAAYGVDPAEIIADEPLSM
jgi:transcriptional regulator with XRE-family HTH domain